MSSDCDAEDEFVTRLSQSFATGNADTVARDLVAVRNQLTREAPDTVYAFFQDNLTEVFQHAKHPFELLIQLLNDSRLLRQHGDKCDLMVLLVRSLKRGSDAEDEEDAIQAEEQPPAASSSSSKSASASTLPPGLTPELQQEAKKLCMKGTYLSPRTYEALLPLFRLKLSEAEKLSYAQSFFDRRSYRECAEVMRMLRLESDEFPHELLLKHLVGDKQNVDVLTSYLSQSSVFMQKHIHATLTFMAEFPKPGEGPAKPSSSSKSSSSKSASSVPAAPVPGNDANLAAKLALKLGYPLHEFPRIVYLKLSDIIWWIVRIGKGDEYGDLLCSNDRGLQKKLVKELMKSKVVSDHLAAAVYLQDRWPHLLQPHITGSGPGPQEKEYADFLTKITSQWKQIRGTYRTNVQIMQGMIDKGLALRVQNPSIVPANQHLLLPPVPSDDGELPLLILDPSAIVIVDSIASLATARSFLRAPSVDMIGVDLEHLPENVDGMNLQPSLCQVLQIACRNKVFLFDMQVLTWNHATNKSYSASSSSSSSSSSPAASSSFSGFPALPVTTQSSAEPSPELVEEMNTLLLELFSDGGVMKVGIGFGQDARKLRKDFPRMLAFQCIIQQYLELTPLLKLVPDPDAASDSQKKGKNDRFGHAAKKEGGLSKLTRMLLRRRLDKSEQISNWSRRPLSVPQLQYGALDAYVPILLADAAVAGSYNLDTENVETVGS